MTEMDATAGTYKGVGFPTCLASAGWWRVIGVRYSLSNCSAVSVTDVGTVDSLCIELSLLCEGVFGSPL